MKKIGFCFLIYEVLNHPEAWRTFFAGVDPDKYQIYIHYKENRPLGWLERHKLAQCIPTSYCHVSIVHAHNLLFRAALQDGCYKVISLSQACIPLKSFDHVYEFLTRDPYAHFSLTPHAQCFPRCDRLLRRYERWQIQKSSNWFILNRGVGELVVNHPPDLIDAEYGEIYCPEEHYFISRIYQAGRWTELIIQRGRPEAATTFTNWAGADYPYPSSNGLKNYSSIAREELDHLLRAPCLFGRKFSPECALDQPHYLSRIRSAGGSR
jgi:hypothetical protein